jgi:hypothetical protein
MRITNSVDVDVMPFYLSLWIALIWVKCNLVENRIPKKFSVCIFSCVLQIRAGGVISLFDLLIIFKLFHSKFSNINGISPNLVEIRIPKKFSVCKMKIQRLGIFQAGAVICHFLVC